MPVWKWVQKKNIKAVLGVLKLVVGRVTNWDSNLGNWNATNGVYDNSGNRTGYKVETPSGVTNYYDNKGNRTGYTPSQK